MKTKLFKAIAYSKDGEKYILTIAAFSRKDARRIANEMLKEHKHPLYLNRIENIS